MAGGGMIDRSALQYATSVGSVIQVAMVIGGHFDAWIAVHVFMFGGMIISAIAGFLYGRRDGKGYGRGALGGAIGGGICALIGIALSAVVGDTAPLILLLGTSMSALTGAAGGVLGQTATARS